MQQADDFRQECRALALILEPLSGADFNAVTQFKGWTINDVIGHLHMFNVAAGLTLKGTDQFAEFFAPIAKGISQGQSFLETQYPFLDGLKGRELYQIWRETSETLADDYTKADPKARLKWAGPDMSARSSITARQMETWAHGQEIFDLLGIVRQEKEHIRNTVHLGVNTFAWAFINRGIAVPDPAPFIHLTAPSDETWRWNEEQANNSITGSAVDFARVVTQVRNFKDTELVARGPVAQKWMQIAQCFAGAPETPPQQGARYTKNA
jgi:uncharacterized protein (TIGR03084 family)